MKLKVLMLALSLVGTAEASTFLCGPMVSHKTKQPVVGSPILKVRKVGERVAVTEGVIASNGKFIAATREKLFESNGSGWSNVEGHTKSFQLSGSAEVIVNVVTRLEQKPGYSEVAAQMMMITDRASDENIRFESSSVECKRVSR